MPLRKPLALYTALLVGGTVVFCLLIGEDIPPNIATVLQWFGGITLVSYYSSSSFEAIKGKKERSDDKQHKE